MGNPDCKGKKKKNRKDGAVRLEKEGYKECDETRTKERGDESDIDMRFTRLEEVPSNRRKKDEELRKEENDRNPADKLMGSQSHGGARRNNALMKGSGDAEGKKNQKPAPAK